MTFSVILEPASGTQLLSAVKVQNIFQDDFYYLGLFFDNIYSMYTGNTFPINKADYPKPFSSLEETHLYDKRAQRDIKRFGLGILDNQTVRDYQKIYDQEYDGTGGYGVILIRSALYRALQNHWFIYVLPGYRENFLEFVLKYEPKYLRKVKESFLILEILKLIFQNFLPAFDPKVIKERIQVFQHFKMDFQTGIYEITKDLRGGYFLSTENERYIKQKINRDERRLLEFLKPENLKKSNLKSSTIKFIGGLLLDQIPILELGKEILDYYNDITENKKFESEKLDFILSIYILKKYFVSVQEGSGTKCEICNKMYEEIRNFTEEECHNIALNRDKCEKHMVAYLNLRKMYQLVGKDLLLAMKDIERFSKEVS